MSEFVLNSSSREIKPVDLIIEVALNVSNGKWKRGLREKKHIEISSRKIF